MPLTVIENFTYLGKNLSRKRGKTLIKGWIELSVDVGHHIVQVC